MLIWNIIPRRRFSVIQKRYSIGIVTYINRFEKYFKPLINALTLIFPETEIVVVINGYYDLDKQRKYLENIQMFLKQFPNVKIIAFEEAQSLSKLWNLTLINATNEKVLILNDDLKIAPWFRRWLDKSDFFNTRIALINRSWSHFLITKDVLKEVGWFDERFPAMGNEDEDYEARLALQDVPLPSFKISSILNVVDIPMSYSYGKAVDLVNIKYVKSNQDFFDSKWEFAPNPQPGFSYVEIMKKHVKLKSGMETPNFYPDYFFRIN